VDNLFHPIEPFCIATAQAPCFDPKIMAQPCIFTENSFKFSDQNNTRARSRATALKTRLNRARWMRHWGAQCAIPDAPNGARCHAIRKPIIDRCVERRKRRKRILAWFVFRCIGFFMRYLWTAPCTDPSTF
jgi:hypothetical protein